MSTNIVCPNCQHNVVLIKLTNCEDYYYQYAGQWDVYECKKCNISFTFPQINPDLIYKYYPEKYSSFLNHKSRTNTIISLFKIFLKFPYYLRYGNPRLDLKPNLNKELLEIGCGTGIQLLNFEKRGWKCTGIDISETAVEIAKMNCPQSAILTTTFDRLFLDKKFSAIVFNHVLEHMPYPKKTIQKCNDMLLEGGQIHIIVPNINSFEGKIFGKYWRALDIPRHYFHFNPHSISMLLIENSFEIISIKPAFSASSISESILFILAKLFNIKEYPFFITKAIYVISIFPASILSFLGCKGVISVTAKKIGI